MRMTRSLRRLAWASMVVALAGCDERPRSEGAPLATAGPSSAPAGLSRRHALDSARAFIARSSAASEVHLDSTAIEAVDSLWRVTFRRRALVLPNVVTVDVHARTGAMRFPGDE